MAPSRPMWAMARRGLWRHKARLVATVMAVVLGVSFMSGTQALTGSLQASFDKVFADVYRDIDVVVRDGDKVQTPFGDRRGRISESVVATVSDVAGVTAAEGQVVGIISVLKRDGTPVAPTQGPPNFALNWLSNPELNGWELASGRAPVADTEMVLDTKSAGLGAYKVGDRVVVQTSQGSEVFVLVGVATFNGLDTWGGTQAALFSTTRVQQIVGEPGKIDWVAIAGNGSQDELAAKVAAAAPGFEVVTGEQFTAESQDAFARIVGVLNTFLTAFAAIALAVGSFIIFNTFSIIVAQRTRELALVRAVGASRRQVLTSVLSEAFTVAVVASALGAVCGVALAGGLLALLRTLGFALTATPLVVSPYALAASFAVGAAVTVVAAAVPAVRASAVAPLAVLRESASPRLSHPRRRVMTAAVSAVASAASVRAGLAGGELLLVGAGAVAAFCAVIALSPLIMPSVVRVGAWPLRWRGMPGRLAVSTVRSNPRRASTTAAALMIGVALVAAIAVAASSFKAATSAAIGDAVIADVVVSSDSFGPTALPEATATEVASVPGVRAVSSVRGSFANVDGSSVIVTAVNPSNFAQLVSVTDIEGSLAGLTNGGVAVTSSVAESRNLHVGDTVEAVFLKGESRQLTVEAVIDTRLQLPSGWVISVDLFNEAFPPQFHTDQALYIKVDATLPTQEAIDRISVVVVNVPGASVQDIAGFKASKTAEADRFLIVVYALLGLALLIAVIGVINTLLLSVFERTREIGLLRAVGMSRSAVRASIRWESAIICTFGALIGVGVGVLFGWALVAALADQGIDRVVVPHIQLVAIVVMCAIAGVAAAIYPAWRAGRLKVLDAISAE